MQEDQGQICRAGPETMSMDPSPSAWRVAVVLLTVAAAAWATGWPTRDGEFLRGDDQRFVVEHALVRHPSARNALKLLTTVHGDLYQPIPMLSFQLDCLRARAVPAERFGIEPRAFHLTNIALHALNAVLVVWLMVRLTSRWTIAWAVGLLFATHPLTIEPVAWISGRMVLLASLFALLTLISCVGRSTRSRWTSGAAVILWGGSLLSKVMPTVPLAAAVCDWYRQGTLRRRWAIYAVLLAASAAMTILAIHTSRQFGLFEGAEAEAKTSLPIRVLLAGAACVRNYVWPVELASWTPPPDAVGWLSAEAGAALLVWGGFGALLVVSYRLNRTAFVGLLLFAIVLLPFLGTTSARHLLTADRYSYLPTVGLHLAVISGGAAVLRRLHRQLSFHLVSAVGGIAVLVLCGLWCWVGWEYARSWRTSTARDQRLVHLYPDRLEAHLQLAQSLIWEGEAETALKTIAAARARWPDHPRLAAEAGEALRLRRDWPAALRELNFAARNLPNRTRTLYYRALTLEELGCSQEARSEYSAILEKWPGFAPAAAALARNYLRVGDTAAARTAFEQVLRLNPYHRDSLFELAMLHMQAGDQAEAETLLRRILAQDPQDVPALLNLGVAIAMQGRATEALAILDQVVAVDPNAVAALLNQASLLVALGRTAEAESIYRRLLERHPGMMDAAICLHELLEKSGRSPELVQLWAGLASGTADNEEPKAWLVWAWTANGRLDEAEEALRQLGEDSRHRAFAEWALIGEHLLRHQEDLLLARLRRLRQWTVWPENARRAVQSRHVLQSLSDLPTEVRTSPPGLLALAHALLFKGDWLGARYAAEQMIAVEPVVPWTEEARGLLDWIPDAESSTGTPAATPAEEREEATWPR